MLVSFAVLLLLPHREEKVIVLEGYRAPSDAVVGTAAMKYLPFEVPEGVTKISVRPDLDHGPDPKVKNTVDLGCFDPRGYGPGGPGFRGWQGGAGNGFDLTGDPATTSTWYLPGPIQKGTWYLAQYFLKSTPSGLKYKYTITLSFDGPKPPAKMVPPPRYAPGVINDKADWYAGNLHCHSTHSDGGRAFVDLIKRNRDFGFQFVASTEHNTPSAHRDFAEVNQEVPGVLLLEGTELTTPSGHAGIIGQKPGYFWDFRTQHGDGGLPPLMKEVAKQKAIFIINHPFATCTSCTWLFQPDEWRGASGVEVWNGAWDPSDEMSLKWWDQMLREGQHLNAYGGTDYHRGEDPLNPVAWTYARNLSQGAVMDGLRQGRVTLSRDVQAPRIEMWVDGKMPGETASAHSAATVNIQVRRGAGKHLFVYTAAGLVHERVLEGDQAFHIELNDTDARFIRCEVREDGAKSAMLALTNAVFIGTKAPRDFRVSSSLAEQLRSIPVDCGCRQ